MSLNRVGIDAGGTLVKVAYSRDGELHYRKFPSRYLAEAAAWVKEYVPEAAVCATGGKAEWLQSMFAPEQCSILPEFTATCSGVQHLLSLTKNPPESYILTNVGTGTSIHYVEKDTQIRIGGTGVGGGTMMGLAALLTGVDDFSQMVEAAAKGKRSIVDLLVQDIYEGSTPPIIGDLTASNFGKIPLGKGDGVSREDMLAAVVGLVGETVATTSIFASGQYGTSDIVYIGSTFADNPVLQEAVAGYTRFKEANPLFVEHGEYSGAIGALLACQS
ncbi:type II pantothenate kinase [Gorillibacterium massiliense]|uniref:type II pantothenate kinase n=1 Tax=Gorillibacterium massiliense TaxID=1280390 RepID=UPI0004B16A5F|nr:type II pantothenate kinase [Gorillibacterium massiliense]